MEPPPTTYNAVPLPASLGAGSDFAAKPPEPAAVPVSSNPAAQRLAALKSKMSAARGANHKAVVEEDRRIKLGEDGLKKERVERAYERKQQQQDGGGGAPSVADALLETTALAASEKLYKEDKKSKRRGEYGWDVFNNEAQYRHYKKSQRRTEGDGRAATGDEVVDEGDPDPLAYGHAPPVTKERAQALVEDMHAAALRRASYSRRRTFNEDADVTSINSRNEVYNKKIERAFDPYTAEIKANLERGSAL